MKFVAMLSAVGLVGGASTELLPKDKLEIRRLTGKALNPSECSNPSPLQADGGVKRFLGCPSVWISLDDAVNVGMAIIKEIKDNITPNSREELSSEERSKIGAAGIDFPASLSKQATDFKKAVSKKTIDAAKLLANLKSNYSAQLVKRNIKDISAAARNAIVNPFQVVCTLDFFAIHGGPLEKVEAQIENSLKQAGPSRDSDMEENYLLPMIRMFHGFEACVLDKPPQPNFSKEPQVTKYTDVERISLQEYKRRYGDDGKGTDPIKDPTEVIIEATRTNEDSSGASKQRSGPNVVPIGSETQADPMDPSALQSDIERKMELIKNLVFLNTRMREIGTNVLEASARIIYIAALDELLKRIEDQQRRLTIRQRDAEGLITLTMAAIRTELAS